MNKKTLKIGLNILVFLLIAGFGYYMIRSIMSDKNTTQSSDENAKDVFVSPYEKVGSFDADSEIWYFYIYENAIYVALQDKVSIFDLSGKHQRDFAIKENPREIAVDKTAIFLLYDTWVDLYSSDGQKIGGWEACSDNSEYCSITTTKDYVFVTDAENKNIVQYDKQGGLVRFIKSPKGFIIPSYAFDIININDTIYCANSGRHQIESYTLDGEFIASFGQSGAQAGAFAGCCNPIYLAKNSDGNILTSEKGNPRISCYGRNGKFRSILFDANMLGGGTDAYEMQVSGENIYIASGKTISIYCRDIARNVSTKKSCAGCEKDCPMRKGLN
ncbi:MAG: hypothetical protein LBI82_09985 [Dysgonamonadaceae bacterium]|jgi:hypothetical protein|nr:hypothetical protein [Dysgonamonadaceae bacterium]